MDQCVTVKEAQNWKPKVDQSNKKEKKDKDGNKKKIDGPVYVAGMKNKKNQAPSYTDRVLFRNNTCQKHTANKYGIMEGMLGSDHRPVYLDTTLDLTPYAFMDQEHLTDASMQKGQQFSLM
jgi:hypothetical protein